MYKTRMTLWTMILFMVLRVNGTTYYIDYDGGDDSRNGLTRETAWRHCPGMRTAAGTAGTYRPGPGDTFVFKGGVTWTHSAADSMFPVYCTYNSGWSEGSGEEPVAFTVDKDWYAGNGWTKPVLDGGALAPIFFRLWYNDHFRVEHLEMTNHGVAGYGDGAVSFYYSDSSVVKDCWIHDWVVTGSIDHKYGGIIANKCSGITVDSCLIYGSPPGQNGIAVLAYGTISNNTIFNVSNGVLGGGRMFNNHLYNITNSFDPDVHENAMYIFGEGGSTSHCYNNIIHDVQAGIALFLVRWGSVSGDCTFEVYNNIIYKTAPTPITIDNRNALTSPENNYHIYNNILQGNNGVIRSQGEALNSLIVKNNICLTHGTYTGVIDFPVGSQGIDIDYNVYYDSLGSEVVLNHPTAGRITMEQSRSLGYNVHSIKSTDHIPYDYRPRSATDIGVDAGTDMSSVFDFDMEGQARPAGEGWDIGAYEYRSVPVADHFIRGIKPGSPSLANPVTVHEIRRYLKSHGGEIRTIYGEKHHAVQSGVYLIRLNGFWRKVLVE